MKTGLIVKKQNPLLVRVLDRVKSNVTSGLCFGTLFGLGSAAVVSAMDPRLMCSSTKLSCALNFSRMAAQLILGGAVLGTIGGLMKAAVDETSNFLALITWSKPRFWKVLIGGALTGGLGGVLFSQLDDSLLEGIGSQVSRKIAGWL